MSQTVVVQIGNSDNKLTQAQWANFVSCVRTALSRYEVHFSGGSATDAPWQNFCWVFAAHSMDGLVSDLGDIAKTFNQDSIAVTIGTTQFVRTP